MIRRNRARAGYDRTHILQFGFAAELPFGKGRRWASEGLPSVLLGGWQFNGIFSAVSGAVFTVTASGASLNAPGNLQTADLVKPFRVLGGIGPGNPWFDPTAFRPVTDVRFGTTGRNAFRGPGYANLDFSLFRAFPITETVRLEFRAEAFNLTNTPHFNNPGTNVSDVQFNPDGTIRDLRGFSEVRSSFGERYFRFGLRLGF